MSHVPFSAAARRSGEQILEAACFAGTQVGRVAAYLRPENRDYVVRKVRAYLREHPGAFLGVAAGTGFLVGLGTKRR